METGVGSDGVVTLIERLGIWKKCAFSEFCDASSLRTYFGV